MTKQMRRRFSLEYKEQSVARLSEPGATHSSVTAELCVTPTRLKTWRLKLEAAGSAAARAALFEYIEIFYNQRRRQSSIGYRTPAQARRNMTIAQAA